MRGARERPAAGCREEDGTSMIPLREMKPRCRGTIHDLSCKGKLRRRLMDMGVVAGAPVEMERFAPLGDPMELKFRGFHLSLRKEEAGEILVEVPNVD